MCTHWSGTWVYFVLDFMNFMNTEDLRVYEFERIHNKIIGIILNVWQRERETHPQVDLLINGSKGLEWTNTWKKPLLPHYHLPIDSKWYQSNYSPSSYG